MTTPPHPHQPQQPGWGPPSSPQGFPAPPQPGYQPMPGYQGQPPQYAQPAYFDTGDVLPRCVVVVSFDRRQRGDPAQFAQDVHAANVTGVKNMVHPGEHVESALVHVLGRASAVLAGPCSRPQTPFDPLAHVEPDLAAAEPPLDLPNPAVSPIEPAGFFDRNPALDVPAPHH